MYPQSQTTSLMNDQQSFMPATAAGMVPSALPFMVPSTGSGTSTVPTGSVQSNTGFPSGVAMPCNAQYVQSVCSTMNMGSNSVTLSNGGAASVGKSLLCGGLPFAAASLFRPHTDQGHQPVAEFLYQLTRMLVEDNREIIEWDSGRIVVHDPHRLEGEVLHKYFRHSKFSSFQRQLNYFGFRKLAGKGKMAPCSYVNSDVTSDMSSLLSVKRKNATSRSAKGGKRQAEDSEGTRSDGEDSSSQSSKKRRVTSESGDEEESQPGHASQTSSAASSPTQSSTKLGGNGQDNIPVLQNNPKILPLSTHSNASVGGKMGDLSGLMLNGVDKIPQNVNSVVPQLTSSIPQENLLITRPLFNGVNGIEPEKVLPNVNFTPQADCGNQISKLNESPVSVVRESDTISSQQSKSLNEFNSAEATAAVKEAMVASVSSSNLVDLASTFDIPQANTTGMGLNGLNQRNGLGFGGINKETFFLPNEGDGGQVPNLQNQFAQIPFGQMQFTQMPMTQMPHSASKPKLLSRDGSLVDLAMLPALSGQFGHMSTASLSALADGLEPTPFEELARQTVG